MLPFETRQISVLCPDHFVPMDCVLQVKGTINMFDVFASDAINRLEEFSNDAQIWEIQCNDGEDDKTSG